MTTSRASRGGASGALLGAVAAFALLAVAAWFALADDGARGDETAAPLARGAPSGPDGGAASAALDPSTRGEVAAPTRLASPAPRAADAVESVAAPPPTGPLRLAVRHAHGPPAAGGRVLLVDPDGALLAADLLDDAGSWEHAGVDGPVELFVLGLTPKLVRLPLETGRGAHELVLPAGAWLAGRLLLDGEPPARRLPLDVSGVCTAQQLPAGVERPGLLRLPDQPFAEAGALVADGGGRFLVSGFDEGELLRVSGPGEPYVIDEAASTPQPVRAPLEGFVLALRREPVIRGRVLHPDGTPAIGALLECKRRFAHASQPPLIALPMTSLVSGPTTDAQGRFALPVGATDAEGLRCYDPGIGEGCTGRPCAPTRLGVELRATLGPLALEVQRSDLPPDRDVDLGDLVLTSASSYLLRVLGERGVPLEGARAQPASRDPMRSLLAAYRAGSGVDGLLAFAADEADDGYAVVLAPGYEAARVDLPAVPGPEPVEVRLAPAAAIILEVQWPVEVGEHGPGAWFVEVRGPAPVFSDVRASESARGKVRQQPHPLRTSMGDTRVARVLEQAGQLTIDFHVRGSRAVLDALEPHTPLELRVHAEPNHRPPREDPDPPPDVTWWTSGPIVLRPAERRTLSLDLRDLELPEAPPR